MIASIIYLILRNCAAQDYTKTRTDVTLEQQIQAGHSPHFIP